MMQYMPQVDNYNAIEAFVRRVYNPDGDPGRDARITIQPYAYQVAFDDLGATSGALQVGVINIAANADFVLTDPRFQAIVDVASLTTPFPSCDIAAPLIDVLLTDSGSQEQLMAEEVPVPTYFAHIASAAPTFMYPRVISGRSQLTVQVRNTSAILTEDIDYLKLRLVFAGVLVRGFQ
jgi:hypothetical protein